jgi:hypothetical protein
MNSPRWLIVQGRNDEAVEILARLRSDGDLHNVDVQMEITSIVQDITFERMANNTKFISLLSKGNDNNRKRLLLGIGVNCFTQLTGINALLYVIICHVLISLIIANAFPLVITFPILWNLPVLQRFIRLSSATVLEELLIFSLP